MKGRNTSWEENEREFRTRTTGIRFRNGLIGLPNGLRTPCIANFCPRSGRVERFAYWNDIQFDAKCICKCKPSITIHSFVAWNNAQIIYPSPARLNINRIYHAVFYQQPNCYQNFHKNQPTEDTEDNFFRFFPVSACRYNALLCSQWSSSQLNIPFSTFN